MIRLFASKSKNYRYDNFQSIEEIALSDATHLWLPVVVDTEFEHHQIDYNGQEISKELQKTITCQITHAYHDNRRIFTHPDCTDIARHPVMESEFLVVDYLKGLGLDCELKTYSESLVYDKSEKTLQIDLYAHFAIAELFRIFQGKLRETVLKLSLGRSGKSHIKQGRRVIAENSLRTNVTQQWASLDKCLLIINGQTFRLRLGIYDTIAVLGTQSLDTLATLSGHELKFKDTVLESDKENMIKVYLEKPEVFDQYALGDLEVALILLKIERRFKTIYSDIGLDNHWEDGTSLRMTIGATVAKMLEASLMNHLGISDIKVLRKLTKPGTCEVIKKGLTTAIYLAKVDGGRCRNNRPTDISVNSLICDIDINGCYGNGLRNQIYPVGNPVILGLPIDSENNKFPTLGEFIKSYGHDLLPGLWQARVSLKKGYKLKYGQDFLMSWIPPKDPSQIPSDSELEAVDWWTEDNVGLTKVFTHEISLALVTHDFMQLIDEVCSVRQRRELLDNLEVVSALYYPKSNRVKSSTELLEAHTNHKGKNTYEVKGKKKKEIIINLQECHAWYGVNLGELIVDKLMIERSKYKKSIASEKPFNELYKLCVNTIYGDQVSPFFEIGNACVGNNITARARAMAWYMEKGFHGFQTITDGCPFEVNRVIHRRNTQITSETVFEVYTKGTHEGNYAFKPLGSEEIEVIEWYKEGEETKAKLKQGNEFIDYVQLSELAMKHLQDIFRNVDVLHKKTKGLKGETITGQFTLEIKNVFNGASFHGSANYIFHQGENEFSKAKMRSYGKRPHKAVSVVDNKITIERDDYKPANEFLKNLYENPERVSRGTAFIDKSILKIGTFKHLYESRWESSKAFPGCTIERVRLLREFSLNQYTFRCYDQFKSWEREQLRLIKKFGQSYEQFFLVGKGEAVNCVEMTREIDRAIRNGSKSFWSVRKLSDYLKDDKNSYRNHTGLNVVTKMQESYGSIYGYAIPSDIEDVTADECLYMGDEV